MTPIETIGFIVLWLVAISLAGLVVLLYRQVERAYRRSAAVQALGISAGNVLPDLEVISDEGTELLDFSSVDDHRLTVLAFVTSTCSSCRRLVTDLADWRHPGVRTIVAVHGETTEEFRQAAERIDVKWLANPGDAVRDFGVMLVPLVYVASGRTVLASGAVASGADASKLVEQALTSEQVTSTTPAPDSDRAIAMAEGQ